MKRAMFLFLFMILSPLLWAQPRIHYTLTVENPVHHYLRIQIDIDNLNEPTVDLQMPAWSPGRYGILDFARNVRDFEAHSEQKPLVSEKIDKDTWRIQTGGLDRVTASYRVFANNLSGDYSQLNDRHGILNGAGLYMYWVGRKDQPVILTIQNLPGWAILSSAGDLGQSEFEFPNYDIMVDHPVQLGNFIVESFFSNGLEVRVSILNNGDRTYIPEFVSNLQKIVRAAQRIMPPLDAPRYTFFFQFVPFSRHSAGMEHLFGTQISRKHDLTGWNINMDWTYWTAAHEFIHAWNGKRLRPEGLGPFDYSQEVYTPLLWLVEGATTYMADLLMYRSGLWTQDLFFMKITDNVELMRSMPGIYERSLEDASFDTWYWDNDVYAETDSPNTMISYYLKGGLVCYAMDFEIRHLTRNRDSFEDFIQDLYTKMYVRGGNESYYLQGSGYTTADVLESLENITGSSWEEFYRNLIAEPGDIPLEYYFHQAGLDPVVENAALAPPYTGLHLSAGPGNSPKIDWIEEKSPAYMASLDRQDVILTLDGEKVTLGDFKAVLQRQGADRQVRITFQRDIRTLETVLYLSPDWKEKEYAIRLMENAPYAARRIREDWLQQPVLRIRIR